MPSARPRPGALALAAATLLAALLVLVGGAAAPPPAPAADLGEQLEQTEDQLEEVQGRKGVLTSTISEFGDRIETLTGQVEAIREREARARERLVARQYELAEARAALSGAKTKLVRARSHLRVAVGVLGRHLVAIYESGSPDVLSVIVGSSGMEDLAARTEYLDRITAMDESVVGRVRDLRNEVRDLVVSRLNSKVQIERARDYIAGFTQSLEENRSTLQGRQEQLLAARDGREAALAEISAHEEELDGSVESIQAQIAEQLRETGSVPLPPGVAADAGEMIWPVEGPIASPFGGRDIGAGYEYHPGIDIAVPEGTPIEAALGGTVAFTEPEASSGGYGNYTCIDHGGGLSTCYAHQSRFGVSAGESVEQGQVIGWTGCTGYCLGPHLHFEVRIFGEVTDPMSYL
jgi:murein DD-endopeptidase MepM/ murein hydrolase activator NlpD